MTNSSRANIDACRVRELQNSATPPRLIDVRTPAEFETVHIPGSYNVPLDLLREHRDQIVQHLDDNVVLVCRSGHRAADAEQTLRQAGLANVHVLYGGITAWQTSGFAVNRGTPQGDLERQVRLAFGLGCGAGDAGRMSEVGYDTTEFDAELDDEDDLPADWPWRP